jgi:hypothetical protein
LSPFASNSDPKFNFELSINRLSAPCFNEGKEIVKGNLGEEHKDYIQNIATPIAGGQVISFLQFH